MPIIAILGILSSGKTALASYLAALAVAVAKGEITQDNVKGLVIRELSRKGIKEKSKYNPEEIIVKANYELKIDNFQFFGIEDLIKLIKAIEIGDEPELSNCILILDEIWSYLESRMGKSKVERLMTYFIMQSAKIDVQIIYTSQLDSMADIRLRSLANVKVTCKNDFEQYFHYTWITDRGIARFMISHKNAKKYIYPIYDTAYRVPLATEQVKKALQQEKDEEKQQKAENRRKRKYEK